MTASSVVLRARMHVLTVWIHFDIQSSRRRRRSRRHRRMCHLRFSGKRVLHVLFTVCVEQIEKGEKNKKKKRREKTTIDNV